MKIDEIDSNFKAAKLNNADFFFQSVLNAPLVLEGLPFRTQSGLNPFRRLPDSIQDKINSGAFELAYHTSGAAVRFRTNSSKIAVRAKLSHSCDMNHMPRAGSAGFDLYCGLGPESEHYGTVQPSRDQEEITAVLSGSQDGQMYDWLVNLPLYGGVDRMEIGLTPDAELESPTPHRIRKPIAFYGSSITQGGCASRPGNAYTSMLCRAMDAEQINLGFSGSGKGEPAAAELIASLDLSAFVMDYDHNAPTAEYLQKTHEPFFRIIRNAHPELPILILSRCDFWRRFVDCVPRRKVIKATYENAVSAGDRNVYFVDGESLFGQKDRTACTVDATHPNDLGFYRMYQQILPVLKNILQTT